METRAFSAASRLQGLLSPGFRFLSGYPCEGDTTHMIRCINFPYLGPQGPPHRSAFHRMVPMVAKKTVLNTVTFPCEITDTVRLKVLGLEVWEGDLFEKGFGSVKVGLTWWCRGGKVGTEYFIRKCQAIRFRLHIGALMTNS